MPLNPSLVKDQFKFLSSAGLDKIVRVYQGSITTGQWIATSYTLFGLPTTIYLFKIAHDIPRPMFTELLWSVDGGTTYVDGGVGAPGGSTQASISFCDSQFIYIMSPDIFTAPVATVNYKVLGSWITNYDTSNPFIESQMYRAKPFSLDSRLNYQKICDQNVRTVTGSGQNTITHPLGYIPNAKCYIEAFPGQVWPLNYGGIGNPFLIDDSQMEAQMFIRGNDIVVDVLYGTTTAGSRRLWYRIYYDD